MNRIAPLAVLALTLPLAACDEAGSDADPCATTEARTDHALGIDARLFSADGTPEDISCATFTVTKPGSDWMVSGTTPSSIDLAPGEYEVEVDWATDDCTYVSAPTPVAVGASPRTATLDLCVDLEGDWTCTDGTREWTEQAGMADGCTLTLAESGLQTRVLGHRLEGAMVGDIAADGAAFDAIADRSGPLSCWRR